MHAIGPNCLRKVGIGGNQETQAKGLCGGREVQSRLVPGFGSKMSINDA